MTSDDFTMTTTRTDLGQTRRHAAHPADTAEFDPTVGSNLAGGEAGSHELALDVTDRQGAEVEDTRR